jgi:uncharacterized protein
VTNSSGLGADEVIARLGLVPLPREGGFFRETYRARETVAAGASSSRERGDRPLATAIYYLLTPATVSALHRLPDDEVFHFYLGDPAEMLQLLPDGTSRRVVFGHDLAAGQALQVVVPAGVWQGMRLVAGGRFALLGTTMAPGFDPAGYEHGDAAVLAARYPAEAALIRALLPG